MENDDKIYLRPPTPLQIEQKSMRLQTVRRQAIVEIWRKLAREISDANGEKRKEKPNRAS